MTRGKQVVAQQDGTGAHPGVRRLQSLLAECLRDQRKDYSSGRQDPRFVYQFCKRNLAPACPATAASSDDAMRIVEENFCMQVIWQERLVQSRERQIDLSIPQFAKVEACSVRLNDRDDYSRVA